MTQQAFSLSKAFPQLLRFLSYVARHFGPLFYGLLGLAALSLAFQYLATSLMIPLTSSGSTGGRLTLFWSALAGSLDLPAGTRTWIWLFFLLMAFRVLLGYLLAVGTTILGKRVHRRLSDGVFRHVLTGEPMNQIYARSIGHYITLAGDDTFKCGTIVSSFIQTMVGFCTALVSLIVLHQLSATLFWGVLAFLAACGIAILFILRRIVRLTVSGNLLSRELNTAFVESLNSLRSIRAFLGEVIVGDRYADQIRRYLAKLTRIDSLRAAIRAVPAFLLLSVGAWITRPGSVTSVEQEGFFAFVVIVISVFTALGQMIQAGMQLITDLRALHDIDGVLSIVKPSAQSAPSAPVPTNPVRSISLQNLVFAYPGRPSIFHGNSFHFEAGKTYAILGPSGTGKSTLADIMLGLVEPQAGFVQINDGSIPPARLRNRILLVEQQARIFSTSLRDNLLFGSEATEDELWNALRCVAMDDFVRRMPNGLDTVLSYQGENFSGGQRQRIGIARALVRKPDVLILDEATSALDTQTRNAVTRDLKSQFHSGILIFITHDLQISDVADEVIELHPTDQGVNAVKVR